MIGILSFLLDHFCAVSFLASCTTTNIEVKILRQKHAGLNLFTFLHNFTRKAVKQHQYTGKINFSMNLLKEAKLTKWTCTQSN